MSYPPPGQPWPPPAPSPGLTPPVASGGAEEATPRSASIRDGLTSLSVVIAWFAVVAVIAAVIWWQVTPLAEYTRTADNATMDEEQLSKQFGTDGWFVVVGAVAGLVSGMVLVLLRRRNPVLVVILVAAGGAFATFVMLQVGLLLGPSDPSSVLASTAVGDKVPLQLKPSADGIWFVWSITALLGGIVALWIAEARDASKGEHAAAYGMNPPQPWLPNQP